MNEFKKKILVIIPTFYPFTSTAGPSIYLHKLFNYITNNKKKLEIKVITTNYDVNNINKKKYSNLNKNYNKNYKVYYSKTLIKQLSLNMLGKIFKDRRYYEIIYFNSFFSFYLIFLMIINFNRKQIFISPRGQLIYENLKKNNYFLKIIFLKIILFFGKKITLVFSGVNEKKNSINYFHNSKNIIIPNSSIYDLPKGNNVSFTSLKNKDRINVLTISRFSRRKNLDLIIKCAVNNQNKKYYFTIAGPDYGSRAEIQKLITKNKLTNVKLLNFVDEKIKNELFLKSDIFLLPSEGENFGNIFLEAVYHYKPIIYLQNSPWSEININNKIGLAVSKNEKSINECLERIVENYEKFKSEDFEKIQKQFSYEVISDIFLDLIK